MSAPVPVQLCFQGGAAKIPFFAAFVEAIEELHSNGEIRVHGGGRLRGRNHRHFVRRGRSYGFGAYPFCTSAPEANLSLAVVECDRMETRERRANLG